MFKKTSSPFLIVPENNLPVVISPACGSTTILVATKNNFPFGLHEIKSFPSVLSKSPFHNLGIL